MKTWKRLVSGLLGLALAASLTGTTLAAETAKTTGETTKTAAAETAKPAGPFSRWFSNMGVNPEDPKASEAVLAKMGTAIQQTKTVGGEMLTLNGAVWDGGCVYLSLTAKSPNLPKHLDGYSWLSSDGCTAKMQEAQWKEYVENKIAIESAGENLSKEERDQWFQYLMEQGQGQMELNPNISVVSREGNTVQLAATMILDAYLEKPELTLHIENVEITGQGMEQPGTRAGDYVLKGPFEFTFTLDNVFPSMNYQGNLQATINKVPVRITSASISPTSISVGYTLDVKGSVNVIHRGEDPVPGATNLDLDKGLNMRLEGVLTKDGGYVTCSGFVVQGVQTSTDGKPITGHWNRKFPYPIDPATVTAVDISGTRVELNQLNLVTA